MANIGLPAKRSLLAAVMLVLVGCKQAPAASNTAKVKFGAAVGNDGTVQGESTDFPAMTNVSFVAGPLQCSALSLTWRLLQVRGANSIVDTKDEVGHVNLA